MVGCLLLLHIYCYWIKLYIKYIMLNTKRAGTGNVKTACGRKLGKVVYIWLVSGFNCPPVAHLTTISIFNGPIGVIPARSWNARSDPPWDRLKKRRNASSVIGSCINFCNNNEKNRTINVWHQNNLLKIIWTNWNAIPSTSSQPCSQPTGTHCIYLYFILIKYWNK